MFWISWTENKKFLDKAQLKVLPFFADVQNFWRSPKWRQGFEKSPIGHILCQFKRRSFQLQCGRICLCDQCWSEIKNCDNFVTPTWTSGRLSFCRFRYSVWLPKIQSFYGWLLALIKQICNATRKSYFFCKKIYLGLNKIEVNCLCVYSVFHKSIAPSSKELCSKMALREVGVSPPWWCHALVLLAPGYWGLFLIL